jgi:hypothetical protein
MRIGNTSHIFIDLLRGGLWEQEVRLEGYDEIDFSKVYQIAEEQSVTGIIAAGLDYVRGIKVPKEDALIFVGAALQLEQRNKAMNSFIEGLIERLREAGVYTLLLKGQGIAQCYERPLWRAAGDVDLFLNNENYPIARKYLLSIASTFEEEKSYTKHLALTIDPWLVELHGSLRSDLWKSVDNELDCVLKSIFYEGNVRSWMNGKTQVFMPRADEDVFYVFTHILQHFFTEGIGLRQICDWCRLLWTYRDNLIISLLEKRLKRAGILTEWRSFAALAVCLLGMPEEAMPLYSPSKKWEKKSNRILQIILETGNFGQNKDKSYYRKYPFFVYKLISLWRNTKKSVRHAAIFPMDSLRVWFRMIYRGVEAVKKEW